MDRLAVGLMIAIAALIMHGAFGSKAMAAEVAVRPPPLPAAVSGTRGSRVLGLILTLEALRLAPEVLDKGKV